MKLTLSGTDDRFPLCDVPGIYFKAHLLRTAPIFHDLAHVYVLHDLARVNSVLYYLYYYLYSYAASHDGKWGTSLL